MSKQAKKALAEAQNQQNQFTTIEMDLQMRFSKLSLKQRQDVANYLNAYNLAAWIYNEIIDEDCRLYIDLAMKYTMETQALSKSMHEVTGDPKDVQQIVNQINNDGK